LHGDILQSADKRTIARGRAASLMKGRGCPERQSILHAHNKRNDWPLKAGAGKAKAEPVLCN
jgi:hypothetical protein